MSWAYLTSWVAADGLVFNERERAELADSSLVAQKNTAVTTETVISKGIINDLTLLGPAEGNT